MLHANSYIHLEDIIKNLCWDFVCINLVKKLRPTSELEAEICDLFCPEMEILDLLEDTGDLWS